MSSYRFAASSGSAEERIENTETESNAVTQLTRRAPSHLAENAAIPREIACQRISLHEDRLDGFPFESRSFEACKNHLFQRPRTDRFAR